MFRQQGVTESELAVVTILCSAPQLIGMSLREHIDYTVTLLFLSALLFCVPFFDIWQDIYVGGKPPISALLENSIVVLLSGAFVWLSVWLVRNDWDQGYAQLVARWSILGTGCVALAYGWVLGFQLFFQNELKPYIIAADGIIIGGLVLFVAGVYNARSERERTARAAERDRFSALFDNTSDAMIAVESAADETVITAVNKPFERTFRGGNSTVVGRPAVETVSEWVVTPNTAEQAPRTSPETRLRAVNSDPEKQVELRLKTTDGPRDYLVDYVPIGEEMDQHEDAPGFFLFTDITDQKERERQFETLSEGTEGLLNARSVEGVVAATRTLVVDLFDNLLIGIWKYDPESGSYHPLMCTVCGTDGQRVEDVSPIPAREAKQNTGEQGDIAFDETIPGFDTRTFDEIPAPHGFKIDNTTVRQLPDPYRLTISQFDRDLSDIDQHLIDLIVANTQAAIRRVNREEELSRRNDQLEFVNSLLRHDIQNSMTIIRARGQALAESLSNQEAEYGRTIVNQSDSVIDLVDQFRVLLNALTNTGTHNTKAVNLSSVLEDRVTTLETTYPDITVTTDIPEETTARADDMLGNLLGNVLDNAVEHNDTAQPHLDVSVTERDRFVVVRIADNGPGVPDEQKETIFRRGNRGLKESDIGSGFGLFFVDTVMEKYGGDVTVSDNEPRGAIFELSFPKVK